MTTFGAFDQVATPTFSSSESQQALWFLGTLIRPRLRGAETSGRLVILEHTAERGYHSPLHRHRYQDEAFFVLDGELAVVVGGEWRVAEAGSLVWLPRRLAHGFTVASAQARYLTVHTPAGFDAFVEQVAVPATTLTRPTDLDQPDLVALTEIAASHGVDIIGPLPVPR